MSDLDWPCYGEGQQDLALSWSPYVEGQQDLALSWSPYVEGQQKLDDESTRVRRFSARRYRGRKVGGRAGTFEIVEIRSRATIPGPQSEHYRLALNLAEGLRLFERAQGLGAKDVQSEAGGQDWDHRRILFAMKIHDALHWHLTSDKGIETSFFSSRSQALSQPTEKPSIAPCHEGPDGLSSEEVLHRLQSESLPHQERRRLIIEAELLDFDPRQLGPLHALLRDFLAKYRESNDREDLVAVGAAIRKCVATMNADGALAYAARLLEPSPRAPVALEVELELAKMVVRKLTVNPPKHAEYLSELADRLFEVADDYLKPRHLAREKYGAIALNAVLGLVLLQSRRTAEVLQLVSGLNVPWFQQLLARRAGRLREELGQRFPNEPLEGLIGSLRALEDQVHALGS
jgi:hypothetical protein